MTRLTKKLDSEARVKEQKFSMISPFKEGSIVLIKDELRGKHSFRYFRDLYQIVSTYNRLAIVKNLAKPKNRLQRVHVSRLKTFTMNELSTLLPPSLAKNFGVSQADREILSKIKFSQPAGPTPKQLDKQVKLMRKFPRPLRDEKSSAPSTWTSSSLTGQQVPPVVSPPVSQSAPPVPTGPPARAPAWPQAPGGGSPGGTSGGSLAGTQAGTPSGTSPHGTPSGSPGTSGSSKFVGFSTPSSRKSAAKFPTPKTSPGSQSPRASEASARGSPSLRTRSSGRPSFKIYAQKFAQKTRSPFETVHDSIQVMKERIVKKG